MEWIKFSEMFPKEDTSILVFDGENIILAYVTTTYKVISYPFYCNVKSCNWIGDSCYCDLIINSESFWMPLPNQPERLSEKTPQGDATV